MVEEFSDKEILIQQIINWGYAASALLRQAVRLEILSQINNCTFRNQRLKRSYDNQIKYKWAGLGTVVPMSWHRHNTGGKLYSDL